MNDASANLPAMDESGPQSDEGWSRKRILFFIALAMAVHIGLIFAFGAKKPFVPKPVTSAPQLQLAKTPDELMELDNPALFALPNPRDFAAAIWQQAPVITPPSFRWKAAPGELVLTNTENLGAVFNVFLQTNRFGDFQLDFKPPPLLVELLAPTGPALPQSSVLQISGALAQRQLLAKPALPSLEFNDIFAPSKVQVTVDQIGNVIGAVLLPADNAIEAAGRSPKGDTNAVALALGLKFAPAAQLMLGEVTFYWHITPLTSTNAPNPP
jgi:hypothetical protein